MCSYLHLYCMCPYIVHILQVVISQYNHIDVKTKLKKMPLLVVYLTRLIIPHCVCLGVNASWSKPFVYCTSIFILHRNWSNNMFFWCFRKKSMYPSFHDCTTTVRDQGTFDFSWYEPFSALRLNVMNIIQKE